MTAPEYLPERLSLLNGQDVTYDSGLVVRSRSYLRTVIVATSPGSQRAKYRLVVLRDCQDLNSYARSEVWCMAQGWKEVITYDGLEPLLLNLPVFDRSCDPVGRESVNPDVEAVLSRMLTDARAALR